MKRRLTPTRIRNLKPATVEYIAWDTDVPHFGVRVRPNGSMRFVHICKVHGRIRKTTLGHVDAMALDDARTEAKRLNNEALVANARPAPDPVLSMPCPTFGEFAEKVWLPHSRLHQTKSTVRRDGHALGRHLLPAFGQRPMDKIGRTVILDWFDRYSKRHPGGANRVMDVLSAILNEAVRRGSIPHNPAKRISRNPKRKMTRFLSDEERMRLLDALDQVGDFHKDHADVIRLLLFTGCRRGEILHLRWDEVQGDRLNLADSKVGPRTVWLGSAAKELIESRRAAAEEVRSLGDRPSPFVFPHRRKPGVSRGGLDHFWRGFRKKVGLMDFRLHDLRHSFATEAVRRGAPLPEVSKLLGHSSVAMTMRYTHVSNTEVEVMAEKTGRIIWLLLSSKPYYTA